MNWGDCMKLNELRVGSIVTHPLFGTPTVVKAIAFNGLYIGTEDGLPIHIDDFKPVELTDDIFYKLNCKKIVDHVPGIGEYDWWSGEDFALTHLYKGLYGVNGLSGIKPIRYVHQLQNVLFVMDIELDTINLLNL